MSIGLNYTHEVIQGGILLPHYLYLLDKKFPITWGKVFSQDPTENKRLRTYIQHGNLEKMLEDANNERFFAAKGIRDIMHLAYPYEILLKGMSQDIKNDDVRNDKMIQLFNTFFSIDYHEVLARYLKHRDMSAYALSQDIESKTYTDRVGTVYLFLTFVDTVLRSQGYHAEADRYQHFADKNLRVKYTEGISGVTTQKGDLVIIEVGNDTYTTLFHELTHFTNKFFRFFYYENHEVCFDNYTKTNEGFANFVAYHAAEAICKEKIDVLEHMNTDSLFFSVYIDIYAKLLEEGSNKRDHNFALIEDALHSFYGELLTQRKTNFYIQRFYKYFHYDQHTYMYPKELMYHIGYQDIRKTFSQSTSKVQLMAQFLLGKVCL